MKKLLIVILLMAAGHVSANELGDGNGSSYPNSIDTDNSKESGSTIVRPAVPNDENSAIVNIQTELGISPSGTYTTVRERLDNIAASTGNVAGQFEAIGIATTTNAAGISTNASDITANANSIITINGTLNDITISTNALAGDIAANETATAINTSSITLNASSIGTNAAAIGINVSSITANQNSIAGINSTLTDVAISTTANGNGITTNANAIADIRVSTGNLQAQIDTNDTDITDLYAAKLSTANASANNLNISDSQITGSGLAEYHFDGSRKYLVLEQEGFGGGDNSEAPAMWIDDYDASTNTNSPRIILYSDNVPAEIGGGSYFFRMQLQEDSGNTSFYSRDNFGNPTPTSLDSGLLVEGGYLSELTGDLNVLGGTELFNQLNMNGQEIQDVAWIDTNEINDNGAGEINFNSLLKVDEIQSVLAGGVTFNEQVNFVNEIYISSHKIEAGSPTSPTLTMLAEGHPYFTRFNVASSTTEADAGLVEIRLAANNNATKWGRMRVDGRDDTMYFQNSGLGNILFDGAIQTEFTGNVIMDAGLDMEDTTIDNVNELRASVLKANVISVPDDQPYVDIGSPIKMDGDVLMTSDFIGSENYLIMTSTSGSIPFGLKLQQAGDPASDYTYLDIGVSDTAYVHIESHGGDGQFRIQRVGSGETGDLAEMTIQDFDQININDPVEITEATEITADVKANTFTFRTNIDPLNDNGVEGQMGADTDWNVYIGTGTDAGAWEFIRHTELKSYLKKSYNVKE